MAKKAQKAKQERRRPDAGMALGPVWLIGWLFTIGYCGMPFFWKGLLALLIWPYFLGAALR
jgi:hypothetical protein